MSTTLEDQATSVRSVATYTAVDRLQDSTAAMRLHIRWLGMRKTLSEEQKSIAANAFDADQSVVSAAKKLLDTSHPAFRAVSAIRSETVAYWRRNTLPYVEPGVRLVPRRDIIELEEFLTTSRNRLSDAVEELEEHYPQLVAQAQERLGDLFNRADYPGSLTELFGICWDYPSLDVPSYLRQVSPEVYSAECQRIQDSFHEAVEIAQNAFAQELRDLVTHLADRLSGSQDGKPKIFRDSAVTNLLEFFERFERLNITSDRSLQELVQSARAVVSNTTPEDLRARENLRNHVAAELQRIEATISNHLQDRPRRSILRRSVA